MEVGSFSGHSVGYERKAGISLHGVSVGLLGVDSCTGNF